MKPLQEYLPAWEYLDKLDNGHDRPKVKVTATKHFAASGFSGILEAGMF